LIEIKCTVHNKEELMEEWRYRSYNNLEDAGKEGKAIQAGDLAGAGAEEVGSWD
jgi:hypothetical protein